MSGHTASAVNRPVLATRWQPPTPKYGGSSFAPNPRTYPKYEKETRTKMRNKPSLEEYRTYGVENTETAAIDYIYSLVKEVDKDLTEEEKASLSVMIYNYLYYDTKYSDYMSRIDRIVQKIQPKQTRSDDCRVGDNRTNTTLRDIYRKIDNGELVFPYKRGWHSNPSERFAELKEYEPQYVTSSYDLEGEWVSKVIQPLYNNESLLIVSGTYDLDSLSDWFNEESRVKTKVGNSKSLYDQWKTDSKWICKILAQGGDFSAENVRDTLYNTYPEATVFKSTVAKSVYSLFNAKRILDPSSGWGDRLIAALSLPSDQLEYYVGVDPNSSLTKGYNEMIDMFAPESDKGKFIMLNDTFEDVNLGTMKFDLVFTSPPYFSYEKYTNDSSQSYVKYPKFYGWVHNFLIPYLQKAWDHLEDKGHLALNISDPINGEHFTEFVILYLITELKWPYLGVIGFGRKRPRPIFVFQKDSDAQTSEMSGSMIPDVNLGKLFPNLA